VAAPVREVVRGRGGDTELSVARIRREMRLAAMPTPVAIKRFADSLFDAHKLSRPLPVRRRTARLEGHSKAGVRLRRLVCCTFFWSLPRAGWATPPANDVPPVD